MQGTDGPRPVEAARGFRERKKGGHVVSLGDSIAGNLPTAFWEHWAEILGCCQCQLGQEMMRWVPRSRSQQEGAPGASSKKDINSPAWRPTSAFPLPRLHSSLSMVLEYTSKIKRLWLCLHRQAKLNFTEIHRIFYLRRIRGFLLYWKTCLVPMLLQGFREKTSWSRKKALKAFEYRFCLFTSVPLTINYSASFPRINSQQLNVSQQAAA